MLVSYKSTLRSVLHIYLFCKAVNRDVIVSDLLRWMPKKQGKVSIIQNFVLVLTKFPEFRTLFYYRVGGRKCIWCQFLLSIARIILPPKETLYISCPAIGPGLFIQHGFATIITARKIGKQCHINQQVTIGYSNKTGRPPVIGDYVYIYAGAKVIGDIKIGNHVKIGCNAVVTKNVPSCCTVVGVPAYIVRKNGRRVIKSL